MGQRAEKKDNTERVTGLGRRTREEIVKWNQMTALRFQLGGDMRYSRPPFGGQAKTTTKIRFKNQGWPGDEARSKY